MARTWWWLVALVVSGPARAGTTYFPGPGTFGTLLFEDQYPCAGDADFNDVVVKYSYARFDSAGVDVHLTATFEVVAVGASLSNGLALRLPVPAGDVGVVTVRIGDPSSPDGVPWSAPVTITPEDAVEPILWLSDDVRAWCGGASGFLNTTDTEATVSCAPITVDVDFPGGTSIPAEEPYDLFLYRSTNRHLQVHRSGYYPPTTGSGAFDTQLFAGGTRACDDGSDGPGGSRWFVQGPTGPIPGLPFALNVGEGVGGQGDGLHWWMKEKLRIDAGAPRIVELADGAADGDPGYDWYLTGVVAADQFSEGAGGTLPPAATPLPAESLDRDGDGYCVGFALDGATSECDYGVAIGDCDDAAGGRHPGATEVWYDGVDADCSGGSDYDQDGDGDDTPAHGGGDCADLDPARSSLEPEACNDVDDDCDGFVDDGVTGTVGCVAPSCADVRDDDGVGLDGTFVVDAPDGTGPKSLTCLNSLGGGGWYQCTRIAYVANTSTVTYGRTGQQIGSCLSCNPPGAPSGPNGYLGVGTTAQIKSQCFGWFAESDFGLTADFGLGPGDWDYWDLWALPSDMPTSGNYVLGRPGAGVSCNNGYTTMTAPSIDYYNSDYSLFLVGSETSNNCYLNGVYQGGSESFWFIPSSKQDDLWLELSDDHFSRLGRYVGGSAVATTGTAAFWVR